MDLLTQLKDLYTSNNQLVLFGEAKNAGLIALNIAVVVGMCSLYNNVAEFYWVVAITYVLVCNLASAIIILSALAAQKLPREIPTTALPDDNYLFYGTISHLTAEELVARIANKYKLESQHPELEIDYARQVIIISQIATRKFARFNYALALTMMSVSTPIGFWFYYRWFYPNRLYRTITKKTT